ncbi:MAG: hypothetical protein K0S14_236 [Thermomicrobiales bacterium]|jgi:hypothetical protein|nr:hypothetical protein [Thermomicrobiales bacterium]
MPKSPTPSTAAQREQWLHRVAQLLLPTFGLKEYPKFRVSCGFPSTGRRGRRIGECWASEASKDANHEIFIHPGYDDGVEVAAILAHEIGHVIAGVAAKHGPDFKKVIKPLGLEGRACATVPGEGFKQLITPILKEAGAYPHGALATGGISTKGPKQSTRMIKVHCESCGYTLRSTQMWLTHGVPVCPNEDCDNHGVMMEVDL